MPERPEIQFSDGGSASSFQRAKRAGRARDLARSVWTTNMDDAPEVIVRRNVGRLLDHFVPGAVVTDRAALEGTYVMGGDVTVVHGRARDVRLPGLRIRPRRGVGPHEDDQPFGALVVASPARALLENTRPSRARGDSPSRTLTETELELWLERILGGRDGETQINRLRDDARRVASDLGFDDEFTRVDALIGALQGTREMPLRTDAGTRRRAGLSVDGARVEQFERFAEHLAGVAPRPRGVNRQHDLTASAFWEAYFSNYIEGTVLAVDVAERAVFDGIDPPVMPQDAHDIRGTFELIVDGEQRHRTPRDADDLLVLLREQHGRMLAGRPEIGPGSFKQRNNSAGGYEFVDWRSVEGTLRAGWSMYRSLPAGVARAAYAMFLVAEVHPFTDGNGRMARLLMNAELEAAGQQRILVPAIYRLNYLQSLRALSVNGRTDALPLTLEFAQRYTQRLDLSSVRAGFEDLARTGAFIDAGLAELDGLRLVLPDQTTPALEDAGRDAAGRLAAGS